MAHYINTFTFDRTGALQNVMAIGKWLKMWFLVRCSKKDLPLYKPDGSKVQILMPG